MRMYRISEVAELAGVSGDTVRRWIDAGKLPATRDGQGHRLVGGTALAEFLRRDSGDPARAVSSARNRFRGLVTSVVRDTVMAQVEIQAGPHRVVSLMSREAADELGLEVGSIGVAIVKSTHVVVETETGPGTRHA